MERIADLPPGTSETRFGLDRRFYADAGETSSFMAAAAAQAALVDADWQAAEIDVLIGACGVMEQPIPGTALLVHRRLGLGGSGIPAFDVNATCLSFLVALDQALAALRWAAGAARSSSLPTSHRPHSIMTIPKRR